MTKDLESENKALAKINRYLLNNDRKSVYVALEEVAVLVMDRALKDKIKPR